MKQFAKRDFCGSLGLSRCLKIRWLDGTGLCPISDDVFARVDLATGGFQGQYDRLSVTIIHRERGALDQKSFSFDDHIPYASRVDDRQLGSNAYPAREGDLCFHATVGYRWYIAVPSDMGTLQLAEAVRDYVALFRPSTVRKGVHK